MLFLTSVGAGRVLARGPSLWSFGLLLAALACAIGCGEKRVPVHPVSGKVTHSEVPVGAQVVLHPVNVNLPQGTVPVTPTGQVREDGSFQITSYELNDGAPAGEYVATIEWFKMVTEDGGSGRGPNVLPEKFAKSETSPLRITVTSGANELPIDITSP